MNHVESMHRLIFLGVQQEKEEISDSFWTREH